jgi:transposase
VIRFTGDKPGTNWLNKLIDRRHKNIAAVALANKNARIVCALLTRDEQRFRADDAPAASGA